MKERTKRYNKIVKVKAKNFSIRVLRDILFDYITTGTYAWQCVKNDLEETIFKVPNFADGEYGYCGMRYDEVRVGSTYRNWLCEPNNLRKRIVYNPDCLDGNSLDRYDVGKGYWKHYSGDASIVKWTDYKTVTSTGWTLDDCVPTLGWNQTPEPVYITAAEAFYNDADVMFFTMFKQYEDGIEWEERMGNERRSTKAKHVAYKPASAPYNSYFDKPPLYPGEGCPAIGSAPNFYKNEDKGDEIVFIYLSRTKHNVLMVVNFQKYWDMVQVGFFEPNDSIQEYAFPALVMSSNIGVRPHVVLEYNPSESVYHHFLYDYTHANKSWGRSMPCNTASYWDGGANFINEFGNSPIQAMSPDGKWHSFANWGIRSDSYRNQGYGLGLWHSFKEPERANTKYYITTSHSDIYKTTDTIPTRIRTTMLDWDLNTVDSIHDLENKRTYNLIPYMLMQNDENSYNQNLMGNIPATYYVSSDVNRYGLYKYEEEVYLIVPNCEEGRRWHQKPYYGVFLGFDWTSEGMTADNERYDELSKNMNSAFYLGENVGVEWWGM